MSEGDSFDEDAESEEFGDGDFDDSEFADDAEEEAEPAEQQAANSVG